MPARSAVIYAEKWGMDTLHFLSESLCGHIYKGVYNGQAVILKIFKEYGRAEESRGARFLSLCDPDIAARIYQCNDDAVLMEYLPGPDLKEMVAGGRDDEATMIIAERAAHLHAAFFHTALPPDNLSGFPHLKDWFQCLFDTAEDTDHAFHKDISRAAGLARDLLNESAQDRLLHGDIHHENLIADEKGRFKFIDPKGLVGDPAYDLANAMCNPSLPGCEISKGRIIRQADLIHEGTGYDKRRILAYGVVHSWLSCCWFWRDGFDPGGSLKTAQIFSEIRKDLTL